MLDKKYIQQSPNHYSKQDNRANEIKNIYWGEVTSIDDKTEGGRIKVRIDGLDNQLDNINLAYCYPMLPKFFHIYPKIGEIVRIFIEDTRYPQRSRYWMGSVISQPQKINFDNRFSALSTTNQGVTAPAPAPSTYPDAIGIYPNIQDVAILGRDNTDIILRERDIEMRSGMHEYNDNLKLNKTNPASIRLTFEEVTGRTRNQVNTVIMVSSNVTMADRIALISHDGNPTFKTTQLTDVDRNKIFAEAHPLGRGDVIVEALELLRKAMIQHIHPYSGVPSDKSGIIIDLEKVDFTQILQRNIVIN